MQYYIAKRQAFSCTPHDYYYDNEQALINSQWDNTTTLQSIQEEYPAKSLNFRSVDVRMTHALDRSTNMKQGADFRKLIFQDLTYNVPFGTYYLFEDAYWLTVNLDQFNRTEKNVIVRRCNNYLKWKDEEGTIYSYPCILEYEVTASSPRVDNNIITPNNKVRVIVQANEDTLSIKVNKRFIFGDRPFSVVGLNNYMIDSIGGTQSIMYIHTQLDEISPYDDFENNIAYNTNAAEPIDDDAEILNGIVIDPMFDFVRQNYTIEFTAGYYINGELQSDEITASVAGAPTWSYDFQSLGNNTFSLTCKKVAQIPLGITLTNGTVSDTFMVDLKSMF